MNNSLELISKLEQLALDSQVDVEIEDTVASSFVAGLKKSASPEYGSAYGLWGYNDRLKLDIINHIKIGIKEFKIEPYLVLNLGCGVGNALKQVSKIKGVEVFGVDRHLFTSGGEFQIPRERLIVGDFAHLDGKAGKNSDTIPYVLYKIPDKSFHLIISTRSNRFQSKHYPQYFNQIERILAPGGFAAIEMLKPGPNPELFRKYEKESSQYACSRTPSPINSEEMTIIGLGRFPEN